MNIYIMSTNGVTLDEMMSHLRLIKLTNTCNTTRASKPY